MNTNHLPYAMDPHDFAQRGKGLWNHRLKEYPESVLQNVANPNIKDEDLQPYIFDLLRSIELRIEPYANAPVKGIVSVPFEDASLDEVRGELAIAITRVLRKALREATLKALVDQHPG